MYIEYESNGELCGGRRDCDMKAEWWLLGGERCRLIRGQVWSRQEQGTVIYMYIYIIHTYYIHTSQCII